MRPSLPVDPYLHARTGISLTVVAFGFGVMRLRQAGVSFGPVMTVALAMPASATLLFGLVGIAVPGLFATKRLRFPLPLTLPLVYATLLVVSVVLWTTQARPLFSVPQALRIAGFWTEGQTLSILVVAQALTLSILAWLDQRIPPIEKPSASSD